MRMNSSWWNTNLSTMNKKNKFVGFWLYIDLLALSLLGLFRGLSLGDRTWVEVWPSWLFLHLHQPLHKVEGVVGRPLPIVTPLEWWEFSGGHRWEFWGVEPQGSETSKVPTKTGLSLKKFWRLVRCDTYWEGLTFTASWSACRACKRSSSIFVENCWSEYLSCI